MQIIETLGIILLIVTSHGKMGDGKPTGLWLEEFAVPYEVFVDAGYVVIIASPQGGATPIDPRSIPENPSPAEEKAIALLKNTLSLESLDLPNPQGIFFSGGHGTMFDFPNDKQVKTIVEKAYREEIPLALVCHGPAALVAANTPEGTSVVFGKKITGFTNSEEDAVNLTDKVPFLLETKLKDLGGEFSSAENFQPHVVVDGLLITGQNPSSSQGTAQALLEAIK